MTNREYSAKHIRRMKLFEAQFLRRVYLALRTQVFPVVAVLREFGPQAALDRVEREIINDHVAPVVQEIYKTVGLYFANKTIHDLRQSIKEQKAGFGFNEEFIRAILQYFASFLLADAVLPITQTTREQIARILNQGITEGWGVDKMARAIESPDMLLWRARMIVRTESNKAMNQGKRLGESKSGVESTKTWIAANDHRTRHSHRTVDDKTIDFNEYFRVPIMRKGVQVGVDLMEGPGDIHASAGNVINCRCVLAFKGKRDANGRLIRKKLQPLEAMVKSVNDEDMTPEECSEIMAEVKAQILAETKNEIIKSRENIMQTVVTYCESLSTEVANSGVVGLEMKTDLATTGRELAFVINDTEIKQQQSVDRLIDLIQSKDYNPEIKLQTDSAEVVGRVNDMREELIDLLVTLKDELNRKKTWVHTIERDSNDLIKKITSKQI